MSDAFIVLRFRHSPTIKQWLEWHQEYKHMDMYLRQENKLAYNQCFSKFISFSLMINTENSLSIFIDGEKDENAITKAKQIFSDSLKEANVNKQVDSDYVAKGFSFAF